MTHSSQQLLSFALQLCDEAAIQTKQFFRQPITISQKSDLSPVTIADQQTEQHLREMIHERFPHHGMIGEEFGQSGESEWQWVIDPIDGTRSFIAGNPLFACLIALLYQDEPVLSVIEMPMLGERFYATQDGPCFFNQQRVQVSDVRKLAQAKLYSTDPQMFNERQFSLRSLVAKQVSLDRYGGDGYLYAMLAAGWIDLVIEADLKPYDFLPLKLIVERAGGIISDWQGNPLTFNSDGEVIASATPALHEEALKRLAS